MSLSMFSSWKKQLFMKVLSTSLSTNFRCQIPTVISLFWMKFDTCSSVFSTMGKSWLSIMINKLP